MNRRFFTSTTGALLAGLVGPFARSAHATSAQGASPPGKVHRIAFQISNSDPAAMNLLLGNVTNFADHYASTGEAVQIEVVAFGPGFAMLRDTSPVKARVADLQKSAPFVVFSACQNSRRGIAHAEGKTVDEIIELPGTIDVPAGVVRLSELQEQGWSYLRP